MPDITAGGTLTVLTIFRYAQGNLTDRNPLAENNYLRCGLTSTDAIRTLEGGLIGLANRPIPWT